MRMKYYGDWHAGSIENGALIVKGKRVISPSAAFGVVVAGDTSRNGGRDWQVKCPKDFEIRLLEFLRP